ncbi:alginate export family protein, partial [Novipirellula sp.]|uniref:alginate export family protein n=1 Tax=Novipirellula sp. TaxID=2795430 RepID=UPI003565CB16
MRVFLVLKACSGPIFGDMNANRYPQLRVLFFAITIPMLVISSTRADDAEVARAAYKQSFIDNDFSYLDDPSYQGHFLGERLKRLRPISDVTIDLGGRFRSRYHNENNLRGGRRLTGASDEFTLSQTLLFADVHIGDDWRVFGQAIDATSDGEDLPPRGSEVNRFDMQMLAVDARLLSTGDDQEWWLRFGRQEMHYGSQRLVASRPWRNTPLTHDGVRSWWKFDSARVDAFWVRPIDPRQHRPDDTNFDSPDQSRQFYGVFGTTKTDTARHDLYYFGMTEEDELVQTFAGVPGGFDVHTIGGRVLRSDGDVQFELEGGYQFGSFSSSRQSAGFATVGLGRTFERLPLKPPTWLFYDWASGDDDLNDGVHGT